MASTTTLQATCSWELSYLEMQPLEIVGMEPALSSANLILQTILGPPFAWPWNRAVLTFDLASGSDYTATGLSAFGHLEGGSIQADAGGTTWELEVRNFLIGDSQRARPKYIAPLIDDGTGGITFRVTPAVDQDYTVILMYQKKAPQMISLGSTWYPVPDERTYICQWGHLAMMSLIGNDARFNEYNAKFITSLLGAQGGLTDLERNIFLSNWLTVLSQVSGRQLAVNERYKARET